MIDKYVMPALGGALIWGLILLVFVCGAKVGSKNQRESLYFKCVEMRDLPLGSCARLFWEGKQWQF